MLRLCCGSAGLKAKLSILDNGEVRGESCVERDLCMRAMWRLLQC